MRLRLIRLLAGGRSVLMHVTIEGNIISFELGSGALVHDFRIVERPDSAKGVLAALSPEQKQRLIDYLKDAS